MCVQRGSGDVCARHESAFGAPVEFIPKRCQMPAFLFLRGIVKLSCNSVVLVYSALMRFLQRLSFSWLRIGLFAC